MLHSLAPLRSALLAVSLFWALVHLAHRLALALVPAHRSSSSLLPSHARAHSPRPPRLFAHAHTQVTLRVCTLRVHTTALNAPHDALAAALHTVPRRGALVRLYDAGSVLGVLGMLGALALLSYTALRLWADVPGGSSMDARGVVKRGLNAGGDEGGSGLSPGDGVPVQLIVSMGHSEPALFLACQSQVEQAHVDQRTSAAVLPTNTAMAWHVPSTSVHNTSCQYAIH